MRYDWPETATAIAARIGNADGPGAHMLIVFCGLPGTGKPPT